MLGYPFTYIAVDQLVHALFGMTMAIVSAMAGISLLTVQCIEQRYTGALLCHDSNSYKSKPSVNGPKSSAYAIIKN